MSAGPRGPTAGPLDLCAVEARHPATVVLEAGEHHSQDVRERIQAHVDVAALLAHCRALRAALTELTFGEGHAVTCGIPRECTCGQDAARAVLRGAQDPEG